MTPRERFLQIAHGELTGEAFLPLNLNYGWFMPETLERWHGEGLPEDADLAEYFGFERVAFSGGGPYSLRPSFEPEVVSQDEETQTIRDEVGVLKRVFKHHPESKMPQWVDHPVKTREDFARFRERLDPTTPGRYPADWDAFRQEWESKDCPRGLAPGSFYGHTLQRWVGTENLCMLFYDDPAFVHEMIEYLEWFFLELIKPYLQHVTFEFASFGEDIAYKGRSFMSPAMFREFIQPRYVKLCELMRGHGIDVIFVDSDGCVDELIPLWLEVGINAHSPLEVAAGMDALALKREYGGDIVLAGNIDKRALAKGNAAIDAEAARARSLMDLGGSRQWTTRSRRTCRWTVSGAW